MEADEPLIEEFTSLRGASQTAANALRACARSPTTPKPRPRATSAYSLSSSLRSAWRAQLRLEDLDPRPRLEEIAIELLRAQPDFGQPIYYREWFALLRRAGHHVAGKDPLATFSRTQPPSRSASARGCTACATRPDGYRRASSATSANR